MSPIEAPPKPDERATKDVPKDKARNDLRDEKVHLGPGVLIVKTKNGELLADPGMVIVTVNGNPGVLSQEVYEALGGDYDGLRRKTYLDGAIARRRDDGLPELTKEELAEVEKNYDATQTDVKKAATDKRERQDAAKEKPAVWASSKNAPPTATPTETGTIAPNPDLPAPDDMLPRTKGVETETQTSGTPPRTTTTPQTSKPVAPGSSTPGSREVK